MGSKELLQKYFNKLIADGASQKSISVAMGYDHPNNISMLLSDTCPKSLISPDKIPMLCNVCNLSAVEAIVFTLVRVGESDGSTIRISKATLKFLFMQFGRLTIEHFKLKNDGATPC